MRAASDDKFGVRSSWGEHLPGWHPWEDYRSSYAARSDLGGGPALTLSHDLDLMLWMLGTPTGMVSLPNLASPLDVSCHHGIDMLLAFTQGATANVHLDYFQSPPHRSWELVGSNGRVVIDYLAGTLDYYPGNVGHVYEDTTVRSNDHLRLQPAWDRNDLFVDELRYFFDSIEAEAQPEPTIRQAAAIVQLALETTEGRGSEYG